jgi:predicted MFS family arabinose efflux permease
MPGETMTDSVPPTVPPATGRSKAYAVYVLLLLFAVSVFSYIDRSIVTVLQVQLKQDLGLSDTQLGLLTGASFALLYTIGALPLARLADRTVRRNLITGALFVWSTMTALSGFAQNFVSLIVLRMGVAIGEAGCAPTTHSLIADYFTSRKRATAEAIWALAIPLGTMLGLAVGGWLAEAVGWRHTFLILGLAGVVAAPIVFLTLREPPRGQHDGLAGAHAVPSLGAAIRMLWECRTYRFMVFAIGLHNLVYYAFMSWMAPFYVRLHAMSLADVAVHFALLTGIGGVIGTFAGGFSADLLGRRDARWYMWTPMVASLIAPPFAIAQLLTGDVDLSWLLAIVPSIAINAYVAPINATTQSLMPHSMRAFASAVIVLAAGIVGMGIGPVLVGALSDGFSARLGVDGLRYAIAGPMLLDFAAAALFFIAGRNAPRELSLSAAR